MALFIIWLFPSSFHTLSRPTFSHCSVWNSMSFVWHIGHFLNWFCYFFFVHIHTFVVRWQWKAQANTYKIDEIIKPKKKRKRKKCLSQNLCNMHFVFHHFELEASNHTNKHTITHARIQWRYLGFCLLHFDCLDT